MITSFKMSEKDGEIAAIPELNTRPCSPFSSDATFCATAFWLILYVEISRVNILVGGVGILVQGGGENGSTNAAGALVQVCSCVDA